ncbi:MAG: hypothetical protein ACI3T9_04775 [Romboutsia timonensis]
MDNTWTIAEEYTLPSKGKLYNKEINPNIKLASMTTEHEMRRLAHTDTPYKVMAEIIDDCMVTKPGISAYDMCIGDYQFLLHKLRIVTYGPNYKISTICPYCNNVKTDDINLEDLEVFEYTDDIKDLMSVTLPKTGKIINLKVQTPRLLEDVERRKREFIKKNPGGADPSFLYLLESLIDKVDGEVVDPVRLSSFVRKLPMADTNAIIQTAEKLNSKVGINTVLENDCPVCGVDYKSNFPITSEFFRPTIS